MTHPAVTMLRGREIHIEADRPIHLTGDRGRAGTLPAKLSVLPGALEIVTGEPAREVKSSEVKTY